MIRGTDISVYQGTINFDVLKDHVDFVIVRSSYGNGFASPDGPEVYKDSQFERNRSEVRRLNIPHGFYHFAYPQYNSPEAEADYFAWVLGDLQPGEVIALDLEQHFNGDYDDWCVRFLDKLKARYNGLKGLLYTRFEFINLAGNFPRVINGDYGLWLCFPDGNPTSIPSGPWPVLAMKQYVIDAPNELPGIAPHLNMDLNTFFGDVAMFRRYGFQGSQPDPKPEPEQKVVYIVEVSNEPNFECYDEWLAKKTFEQAKERCEAGGRVVLHKKTQETQLVLEEYIKPTVIQPEEQPFNLIIFIINLLKNLWKK